MESQGRFSEFWDNQFFILVRFILVLAVVCIAEFYSLHQVFPLSFVWLCMGVTAMICVIVIVLDFRYGEVPRPEDPVMMRLLKRYRQGGILRSEDKMAVEYWQSMGYMRTGFSDETPNQEPVDTASFAPEGLELFCQRKYEVQPGVWPSLKRFFVGLASM